VHASSDLLWLRVGGGMVGMFAGAVLGLCVGICMPEMLAPMIFGGTAAGLMTGVLFPEAGFVLAEGTIHFIVGALAVVLASNSATNAEKVEEALRDRERPKWLWVMFWFGVFYALALYVAVHA
jgi:hypothetical protein